MRIHYISYGVVKTGGYLHEKQLFDSLCQFYSKTQNIQAKEIRKIKYYTTFFGYLKLMNLGFGKSNADINIVTARTALSAIMRNWFTTKQVWIVLHNFDANDGKSKRMKRYYNYLFKILIKAKHNRFKIITVAPFWKTFFKEDIGLPNVHYFPNLFDIETYLPYQNLGKKKQIHCGQWSSKNDEAIFDLMPKLKALGYYCYFSTLHKKEAKISPNYDILYFENFSAYLTAIAQSQYTFALIKINEGWNRVAHESILVNTPVIGYNKGGLGNLLKESNNQIVNTIEEVLTIIDNNQSTILNPNFANKYAISEAEIYLTPICNH